MGDPWSKYNTAPRYWCSTSKGLPNHSNNYDYYRGRDFPSHCQWHADWSPGLDDYYLLRRPKSSIPLSSNYWEFSWSNVLLSSESLSLSAAFLQVPQHLETIRLGVTMTNYQNPDIGVKEIRALHIFCYLNHFEERMGLRIKTVTCRYEPANKIVELTSRCKI